MTATITSKGQITIPLAIRERLHLKPGQKLDFDEQAPFLKAHRVIDEKKARAVLGSAKDKMKGKSAAQWIEWMRGPVELPPHAARRR